MQRLEKDLESRSGGGLEGTDFPAEGIVCAKTSREEGAWRMEETEVHVA